MSLKYQNLNDAVRPFMLAEINADQAAGNLYLSQRFNEEGRKHWYELLRESVSTHDDTWLAKEARTRGFFKTYETRKNKDGSTTNALVPTTAHETLAEGEFNRFFVRGLCLYALDNSIPHLVIYRARHSANPRAESEALLDTHVNPAELLNDLRTAMGVDTSLAGC